MNVNEIKLERNGSLISYHMIYMGNERGPICLRGLLLKIVTTYEYAASKAIQTRRRNNIYSALLV